MIARALRGEISSSIDFSSYIKRSRARVMKRESGMPRAWARLMASCLSGVGMRAAMADEFMIRKVRICWYCMCFLYGGQFF